MTAQGVEGHVEQTVAFPVVGHGHYNLLEIRRIGKTGQRQVFVGCTDGMGKLLGGIAGAQHKRPTGCGHVVGGIVGQHVVRYDAVAANDVQERLAHGALFDV